MEQMSRHRRLRVPASDGADLQFLGPSCGASREDELVEPVNESSPGEPRDRVVCVGLVAEFPHDLRDAPGMV